MQSCLTIVLFYSCLGVITEISDIRFAISTIVAGDALWMMSSTNVSSLIMFCSSVPGCSSSALAAVSSSAACPRREHCLKRLPVLPLSVHWRRCLVPRPCGFSSMANGCGDGLDRRSNEVRKVKLDPDLKHWIVKLPLKANK